MFWNKKNKAKIGVLYICTGKYDIYWNQFFESSERNFCPKNEKHYFIFTDSKEIKENEKTTIIFQERLGWPYDTLMRFHMFNRITEHLKEYDYLFFFNANMQFRKKLSPREMFPTEQEKLVAVVHPYYYETPVGAPFEQNKESLAYADEHKARHYVQGCVNGGITKYYLEMAATLASNIDKDKENDIIAVWHDESHLNAYLVKHTKFKALHAGYAKPEGREGFPFKEKILNLNKNNQGGLKFFRS
jgi:hypothetical protein